MGERGESATYEFKAEVRQLLDILAHSLYTNREIFLRELVSNASDALDKVRFELNRGTQVHGAGLPLEIRIGLDPDQNMITVTDTGIGLTREEAIENIGTIAKSGSAEFLSAAADEGGLDGIIGRFGVGFYSVFMAAKEVVVKSRSYRPDAQAISWRSDGTGSFEVADLDEDLPRGTTVEVRLKEDADEFADKIRLKSIIERHSNFISFPIYIDGDQVNTVPALWREPKSQIKDEQYEEFYKFLTLDSEPPLTSLHLSSDAPVQYNSLLFVPARSHDILGLNREAPGLDLYVRRVLIQRGNNELLPEYLGFIRGVVDSEDLPLNISRETFQENTALRKITGHLVRQVLRHLKKIAEDDQEKYAGFWKEHGRVFKLGHADFMNRETFAELLRFNSSHLENKDETMSLADYAGRMKEGQDEIYYVFGPSREAVKLNPHLEIFREKGLEVLYLYDPLDEFVLESLGNFKEFKLKAVEHTDAGSLSRFESAPRDDKPEPLAADDQKDFEKFVGHVRDVLGERVEQVKVSSRLSDSPCCLVNPDGGLTSSMQKILQVAHKDVSIPAKILEINQDHRLIRDLFAIFKTNPHDDYLDTALIHLFESSLLLEGYLKDPHELVGRMQDLLGRSSAWYLSVKKE